jgi:hypothetical protein
VTFNSQHGGLVSRSMQLRDMAIRDMIERDMIQLDLVILLITQTSSASAGSA